MDHTAIPNQDSIANINHIRVVKNYLQSTYQFYYKRNLFIQFHSLKSKVGKESNYRSKPLVSASFL